MRIQGDSPVINELLRGNDEIVFNLVSLIRGHKDARIYSDGKTYLTAQSNADCPIWIYATAQADEGTERELLCILSEAIAENPCLAVNAQAGFVESVLTRFAKEQKFSLSNHGTLNVYSAEQVRSPSPVGKLIASEAKYKRKIADLIQIAAIDDNDGEVTDEQAMQFAEENASTGNLFLWHDGEIVSMARIVRYGKRFARIASVVTKREMRGRGYAKMLVGELAKRVLAEGLIPVLYARAENPSSNNCYSHLGFEKNGEICEFRFEDKKSLR